MIGKTEHSGDQMRTADLFFEVFCVLSSSCPLCALPDDSSYAAPLLTLRSSGAPYFWRMMGKLISTSAAQMSHQETIVRSRPTLESRGPTDPKMNNKCYYKRFVCWELTTWNGRPTTVGASVIVSDKKLHLLRCCWSSVTLGGTSHHRGSPLPLSMKGTGWCLHYLLGCYNLSWSTRTVGYFTVTSHWKWLRLKALHVKHSLTN